MLALKTAKSQFHDFKTQTVWTGQPQQGKMMFRYVLLLMCLSFVGAGRNGNKYFRRLNRGSESESDGEKKGGSDSGSGSDSGEIDASDVKADVASEESYNDRAFDNDPEEDNREEGGSVPDVAIGRASIVDDPAEEFAFSFDLTPYMEHCKPETEEAQYMSQVLLSLLRTTFVDLEVEVYDVEEKTTPETVRRVEEGDTEGETQRELRRNRYVYAGNACRRCKGNRKKRAQGGRTLHLNDRSATDIIQEDDPFDPLASGNISARMAKALKIAIADTFSFDLNSCLFRGLGRQRPSVEVSLDLPTGK